MLRGITKVLVSIAVMVPLVTFGTGGSPAEAIRPGKPICFGVQGPVYDVAILNLTPVSATAGGNGQVLPIDILKKKRAQFANVNYDVGTIDPNVAFTKIGRVRNVCFAGTSGSTVELIADHLGSIKAGYYRFAQSNGAGKRVLNTRSSRQVRPRERRCFRVAGVPGDVAIVNLTPVNATAGGDGLLLSSSIRKNPPLASNVNYGPGTTDPNVALAKIGKDNRVCYFNSRGASVDIIADHLGTIKAVGYETARANGAPRRALDTRKGPKVGSRGSRCFKVTGRPGDVAVVNLNAVKADGPGSGRIVSSDIKNNPPDFSNVNYDRNTSNPNLAFAKIGRDNRVCYVNKGTPTHVVGDHLGNIKRGAFIPARANGAPYRSINTIKEAEVTPTKWSGQVPVRPSTSVFKCGYQGSGSYGVSTRGVGFVWPNLNISNKLRITYYNDPKPSKGDGKNFVYEYTAPSNGYGFSVVRRLSGPARLIPYKADWTGRVKVEVFIGTKYESSATFDISVKCINGTVVPIKDAAQADESNRILVEAANDGAVPPGGEFIEVVEEETLD